jgi:hypothetical protein
MLLPRSLHDAGRDPPAADRRGSLTAKAVRCTLGAQERIVDGKNATAACAEV